MPALQIRDVPEDARDLLAERARQNGQSLNSFLRDVVMREAGFARNAALVDEISAWPREPGFGADEVLEALDTGRQGR